VSLEVPLTTAVTDRPRTQRPASMAARRLTFGQLYGATLAAWLLTRLLVLVHQGAWPWMNAFVVAAARGMVVGDWNDAVRPQLPAVLGVPLVLAGATEQQTVAVLYVVASLIQFGAFVVLVRALFPGRLEEQTLALLIFLLVPYNHSIHHYRDVPVVLASSAVFLLAASFIRGMTGFATANAGAAVGSDRAGVGDRSIEDPLRRQTGFDTGGASLSDTAARSASMRASVGPGQSRFDSRGFGLILGAMLLGVWSRTEVLTFVGTLIVLSLLVWRGRALWMAASYGLAAILVAGSLLLIYKLEGVDTAEASLYQAHTFLDSTPDSWLTAECRADPTENCREADGLRYFGPADLHAGVLPLVLGHPLTTVAKTLRSAWDNLWILLGPNLSTFPGIIPFVALTLAFASPARDLVRRLPAATWIVVLAVLAETVLPPLSWAPPHPQYHLQLVLPIVVLVVPVLVGLARVPRGRLVALAFLVGNAGLSAFRYTRYPGY
jgi:hypothetical protein